MRAHVYKSTRKANTYVYLAARDGGEALPEALRSQLGPLTFVLETELTPQRKLARESTEEVMANLAGHGFHLQMPMTVPHDPLTSDWGTDA
ncbi:YcgL domain-containing protein [Solilutibacter silvestris]|uniref:YcgL domain-containing protein n=1 Tax=Solilutibacter silvestris TaxID=1645665 RepID=A0A2K1Q0J4_9GAMM|nr:YcgL domain-containing protein [Lysobacter silvestris]PNS08565.1 hypothetical protein Lysil_0194 [Lysobacter silvestris]